MGGLFSSGLTKENSAVTMPGGGTTYYPDAAHAGVGMAQDIAKTARPSTMTINGGQDETGAPVASSVSSNQPAIAPAPTARTPSFRETSIDSTGDVKPGFTGMTKLGALSKILYGGLRGGVDAIQSGALDAPVNGESPITKGVYGALNMPIYRKARQQQIEGEGIKNQLGNFAVSQIPVQQERANIGLQNDQAQIAETQARTRLYQAQQEASTLKANTPEEIIAQKSAIAKKYGLDADQTNEFVFGIKPQKDTQPKEPGRDDKAIAIYQKEAAVQHPDWSPDQTYKAGYERWVDESKVKPGVERAQVYINGRLLPVEDPATGGVTYASPKEITAANVQASQGGGAKPYAKGTNFQKNAFTPKARFDDIDRVATATDNSIKALDQDNSQRLIMAKALQSADYQSPGTLSTFVRSQIYKDMNPTSRNYVTSVLSLREQIMGINQMLTGSAGTSDARVQAIWDTLPNGSEPDSDMARRKMELVRGMVKNLKTAFPLVGVVEKQQSGQPQQAAPAASNPHSDIGFIPITPH